jgi:alkylation response protein AidB-like acyl-CoA dehydrogenase
MARKELNGRIYEDDSEARFPIEKWKSVCALDFLALPVSEEYGGMGESLLTTALAMKTLAANCKDEGLVFSLCAHLCTCLVPISLFGTPSQKRKYLPGLCKGELIGANGTSEAGAGSDLSLIQTKVERVAQGYRLDGSKIFVTNASIADVLIIYARHSAGSAGANLSAFIVDRSTPGIGLGQTWKKMGLRTSPMSEMTFDDCRVGEDARLGRERFGLAMFNRSMIWERVLMAAYHIGAMELQFNEALDYSNSRSQFGSRIGKFQMVAEKLVKMRVGIEAAKALLYQTCWKLDQGCERTSDASILKLVASEAKVANSLDAVQIFGAYGFMKESLVEKQLRDSIGARIYSGTTEIQKKLIADELERVDE